MFSFPSPFPSDLPISPLACDSRATPTDEPTSPPEAEPPIDDSPRPSDSASDSASAPTASANGHCPHSLKALTARADAATAQVQDLIVRFLAEPGGLLSAACARLDALDTLERLIDVELAYAPFTRSHVIKTRMMLDRHRTCCDTLGRIPDGDETLDWEAVLVAESLWLIEARELVTRIEQRGAAPLSGVSVLACRHWLWTERARLLELRTLDDSQANLCRLEVLVDTLRSAGISEELRTSPTA